MLAAYSTLCFCICICCWGWGWVYVSGPSRLGSGMLVCTHTCYPQCLAARETPFPGRTENIQAPLTATGGGEGQGRTVSKTGGGSNSYSNEETERGRICLGGMLGGYEDVLELSHSAFNSPLLVPVLVPVLGASVGAGTEGARDPPESAGHPECQCQCRCRHSPPLHRSSPPRSQRTPHTTAMTTSPASFAGTSAASAALGGASVGQQPATVPL
jgi:hypothetical protein